MLAIGSPDFGAQSSAIAAGTSSRTGAGCGELDSVIFSPLPGTEQEVNDLHGIWSRYTDQDFLLATGSAAREALFKREAPGRRIVHLATHGFFLDGQCSSARAGARGVTGLASTEDVAPPTSHGENPLALAGLALAGANHRTSAGADEEDGIVTAEEITSLDLHGVQWVVLSACDTGLGKIQEGEGVLGLRRAFQLAGVRTLIMSLWSVDDVATRQWMLDLYRARLDGGSTVEAVRQASIENIARRRRNSESLHPFYWGAFVAVGDWS